MKDSLSNVVLQDLRDFIVKIYLQINKEGVTGTGFFVSLDGKIITCAHVLERCGIDPKKIGSEVDIYFSKAKEEIKNGKAQVIAFFSEYDEDIVLLQLENNPFHLGNENVAYLGSANLSISNSFRSFGYRQLENYAGLPARGTIVGFGDKPFGKKMLIDPLIVESKEIDLGMSGAPILDEKRNLVVGVISKAWYPILSNKDQETNIAIDAKVLSFYPLNLPMMDEDYYLCETIYFSYSNDSSGDRVCANLDYLADAPSSIREWVGRDQILKDLSYDWLNNGIKITGLIGFGGEGKSSLARHWIDDLRDEEPQIQPDGIFWWNFDEKPNVDMFFSELLSYLELKKIDNDATYFADSHVNFIAKKFFECHYILVLDNLETIQYQEGENIGSLKSGPLLKLLKILASNACNSFSLITSQFPLVDLITYRSYKHREVGRLDSADGVLLLHKLNVKGSNEELEELVEKWEGYALILSILGSHLTQNYNGNISMIKELRELTSSESRYELINRVLINYDKHLTNEKRTFLMVFSLLRLPVKDSEMDSFFSNVITPYFSWSGKSLGKDEFTKIIKELVKSRILLYNNEEKKYTIHPLLRNHYSSVFYDYENKKNKPNVHKIISDYYISLSGKIPKNPSLMDLQYLIEALHHSCYTENFDRSWHLYRNLVQRGNNFLLTKKLGSYETELAICKEFFQDNNIYGNLRLKGVHRQVKLLISIGYCFSSIGSLKEALYFYEKSSDLAENIDNYLSLSNICQNLSRLYIHLGDLKLARKNAESALEIIENSHKYRIKKQSRLIPKLNALCSLAWICSLEGKFEDAGSNFQKAKVLNNNIFGSNSYLKGFRRIYYADHLIRVKDFDGAKVVILANKYDYEESNSLPQLSRCYRVLGDIEFSLEDIEKANSNYAYALEIARKICRQDILIEALIAHGKCKIVMNDLENALNNLLEALKYATEQNYRIYEVDIRIRLKELYLKKRQESKAEFEAEYVKKLSGKIGYYWGFISS